MEYTSKLIKRTPKDHNVWPTIRLGNARDSGDSGRLTYARPQNLSGHGPSIATLARCTHNMQHSLNPIDVGPIEMVNNGLRMSGVYI